MTIVRTDLQFYKSLIFNDTVNNGGAMSSNIVVDAVSENIFLSAPQSERLAGSTKYRKVYAKAGSDNSDTLYSSRFYIENPTTADERVFAFPASSFGQKQSDLTGSERLYGCGWLNATVSVGATQIVVRCESSVVSERIFVVGDTIRISNKTDVDDVSGTEEFREISAVSWTSNLATIDFVSPLDNAYSFVADATRVSSLIPLGNIKASFDNFVVTSAGGDYNEITNPVVLNNKGAIYQTWTLAFTSGSSYTITGDTVGSIGAGNVTSGASPTNPNFSRPYFTLAPAGFSGVFTAGDTIVFRTIPAALGVWFKRVIPASTPAFSGNRFTFVLDGETD